MKIQPAILIYVLAMLLGCISIGGEPLIEPYDPCAEVHEVYPGVRSDSCSWVLSVMRDYPPPEFLPPATDTGGLLMAARILTDTGEVLFVAQGIPARFLGTPCEAGNSLYNEEFGLYLISGTYCDRPPVDEKLIHLSFFLSDSLEIYQEPQRWRLYFNLDDDKVNSEYELIRDTNISLVDVNLKRELRIIAGKFEATLHNRRDPTDSIRIVDGRFDMRYW